MNPGGKYIFEIQPFGFEMLVLSGLTLLLLFATASMTYVYAFRGQERFVSLNEYMRKGWPIFAPLNCVLYLFTKMKARKAIMKSESFAELQKIDDNWETIKDEAVNLYESGFFDQTKDPASHAYYDVGFRTFYKYGWSKFYLKWYGYTHKSAQRLCPKTVEILKDIKSVNGAMFSVLPPGSKLTRHLDPVASSLRYHLGLKTPESDDCFISVDGQRYSWRDGESFLFDETYLHYARNDSKNYRIILMCDVERPMYLIGSVVNFFYKIAMRMSIVPNTSEDQRGLANRVFSSFSPSLKKVGSLKKTNKSLYLLIKYTVNFALLAGLIAVFFGLIMIVMRIADLF